MIHFENLTKRYGSLTAVDDLSFTVHPGKVTGFLGPNGAGKTTTMRMATSLVRPDAGQALFDGRAYRNLKNPLTKVGVVMEPTVFHPGRTALDHLLTLAPYARADKRRCLKVLRMVGLGEVADKRVGQFSLGMRGRLNLAATLLGDPGILLLDEPVNGLDPEGIRWMRGLLRSLADQGRTILISSHLLTEMQQTVDEVVIIAHGKLVYEGSLAFLEQSRTAVVSVQTPDPGAVVALAAARGWKTDDAGGRPGLVMIEGPAPSEVAVAVVGAGIQLDGLAAGSTDLESVFLALTEGEGGAR